MELERKHETEREDRKIVRRMTDLIKWRNLVPENVCGGVGGQDMELVSHLIITIIIIIIIINTDPGDAVLRPREGGQVGAVNVGVLILRVVTPVHVLQQLLVRAAGPV